MTEKGKPDTTKDDATNEYLKAEANRQAESDPPDNAQASLDKAMNSDPDLGRKSSAFKFWGTVKRWIF